MSEITLWNGRNIPRIGIGTWAIGGLTIWDNKPLRYGEIDNERSKECLALAYDRGCRVFDTAPGYGAGNAEILLGDTLLGKHDVVIVTKCGFDGDPITRRMAPMDVSQEGIRRSVEASLKRLRRDYIDVVLLHPNHLDVNSAEPAFYELAKLQVEGKIGVFGWSTDNPVSVERFSSMENFAIVEHDLNVFDQAQHMLKLVSDKRLISIARLPLAMGLLTGKYDETSSVAQDDVRASDADWLKFFNSGSPSTSYLKGLESLRDLLTSGGRTLAQGAICWILAKAPSTIPVPGFTRPQQVIENLGALDKGPFPASIVKEIDLMVASFTS